MAMLRKSRKATGRRRQVPRHKAIDNRVLPKHPLPEDQAAVQELRKYPRRQWRYFALPSQLRTRVAPRLRGGPWDTVWTLRFPVRPGKMLETFPPWFLGIAHVAQKRTVFACLEWAPAAWNLYLLLSLPRPKEPAAKHFVAELLSTARADGVALTRRRYDARLGPGHYLRGIRYFSMQLFFDGAPTPAGRRAGAPASSLPSPQGPTNTKEVLSDNHA